MKTINKSHVTAKRKQIINTPSLTRNSPTELRQLRRHSPLRAFCWRWRWVLCTILLAISIESALSIVQDTRHGQKAIVVANTNLPAGHTLTKNDLTLAYFPERLIPDTAIHNLSAALQKVTTTPLTTGMPLTSAQLLTQTHLALAPPHTVIMAVKVAPELSSELLQTGSTVDIYHLQSSSELGNPDLTLISKNAVVMGTPSKTGNNLFNGELSNNNIYYLAINEYDARLVLGAQATNPVHLVLKST